MIPEETRDEIMRRLAAVEEKEGVRILLAIESGRNLSHRPTDRVFRNAAPAA